MSPLYWFRRDRVLKPTTSPEYLQNKSYPTCRGAKPVVVIETGGLTAVDNSGPQAGGVA